MKTQPSPDLPAGSAIYNNWKHIAHSDPEGK